MIELTVKGAGIVLNISIVNNNHWTVIVDFNQTLAGNEFTKIRVDD